MVPPRILRFLGLFAIVSFLFFAFTPLPNYLARRLEAAPRIGPAGAIVVLGAGVDLNGQLTSDSLRRLVHGIVLYRRGYAPILAVSGPAYGRSVAEAEVRAELAREMGVPPGAIVTVPNVHTTREEAIRMGELLQPRGVRRVLLVTDSQHMPRARALFARADFDVLAAPVDDISDALDSPEGRLRLTRRLLQELVGRVYYRMAGYI